MLQGFEVAAAAMKGRIDQQDAIANNLANVNSIGYKRKVVGFSTFDKQLQDAGSATRGSQTAAPRYSIPVAMVYEDLSAGEIRTTGSNTDVALDGPGSFVVEKEGKQRFTRSGAFKLDNIGQLVSSEGAAVLGENGLIQIDGNDWSIDSEGNVRSADQIIDKLKIEGSETTKVVPNSLETSNVNAVEEMVKMITAMRSYEACQKTIKSLDQILDKAINQMGRVA